MREKNQYTDVEEMVRETASQEFAERFAHYADERRLVTQLVAIRGAKGLAQKDVAERMKCSQSRVSKLESSVDRDLRFGDIVDYAKANGLSVTILLTETPSSLVAQIKYYALHIKRLLDRLAGLVKGDADMAKGAARLFGETVYNVARFAQEAAKKLPVQPEDGVPLVTIEVDAGFVGPDADCRAESVEGCAEDCCEAVAN
jgi:transcriptional regulator with XRE-family HTH domain